MTDLTPKEIGRRAGRIFAYRLPSDWVLRSQEDQEDYGIDAEIEVISPQDKATGFIFKAQIKGQLSVRLVNQGNQVSFDLSVERLQYYMQQIELPLILVVVDVGTEAVYWTSLQDNELIAASLRAALDNGQKTVAVHLPAMSSLPDRAQELLGAVQKNMNWLRLHALDKLSGPVDALIRQSTNDVLDTMLYNSKKLNFEIYNEQFERLLRSQQHETLFGAADKVIQSATELPETRIVAGLYIERLMLRDIDRLNPRDTAGLGGLYGFMLRIVRHEHDAKHLRLLAVALNRALRLSIFVTSDYHYHISSKHIARASLTGWILDVSRLQVSRRAGSEIVKTILLVNRIIKHGYHGVFLGVLPRIVPFIVLYARRLDEEDLKAQAAYVSTWLKFCVDLAAALATATGNTDALIDAITANAVSAIDEEGSKSRITESRTLADRIQDPARREEVKKHLDDLMNRVAGDAVELTPEQEIEGFRARALGLGFDLDNPEDEMARIIHQGLVDYNPERVIRDCEALIMVPTRGLGVPAQMVGLPSAGMKFLYCLKKGYAMAGWRLDDIYTSPLPGHGFKAQYCDGCEFRKARVDHWNWSSKWQHELAQRYKDLFDRLDRF